MSIRNTTVENKILICCLICASMADMLGMLSCCQQFSGVALMLSVMLSVTQTDTHAHTHKTECLTWSHQTLHFFTCDYLWLFASLQPSNPALRKRWARWSEVLSRASHFCSRDEASVTLSLKFQPLLKQTKAQGVWEAASGQWKPIPLSAASSCRKWICH